MALGGQAENPLHGRRDLVGLPGVAALFAGGLLQAVGLGATSEAQHVCLVVALTER